MPVRNINKDKKTLFIWPEGALSGQYFFEIEKFKNLIKRNFSEKHLIVLGVNTLDKKNDEFFNSFLIIDSKFNKKFQYNKIKLVPFGEFLPFEKVAINLGLKTITNTYQSYTPGNKREILNIAIKELYFKILPLLIQLLCLTSHQILAYHLKLCIHL